MFTRAYSRTGCFIGIRDMSTGRFVPDATPTASGLSKADIRRARRIAARRAADAAARAVSEYTDADTNRVHNPGHYLVAGEKVTRKTRLADTFATPGFAAGNALKFSDNLGLNGAPAGRFTRRHTVGDPSGEMTPARSARGLGALSAPNHRMGDRARARSVRSAPRTWARVYNVADVADVADVA